MSNCDYCHDEVLSKHDTIAHNHEKCTMDYIDRSKSEQCVKCGNMVGNQREHICHECHDTNADYTGYAGIG